MKHRYQEFHGHRQMRTLLISTYEMGRQPFGLASPAAWLRQAGVDVTCLDLSRQPFRDELASVDFVAFHLPMHTATRLAVPVIRRVRELNPDATLCCYGLYAPLNQEVLSRLGVEAILGGEFEADLLAMIAHFQKLANKPFIYLCLPAPVYQTRWGINEKTVTGDVIPIIRKVSKDTKLPIVDFYQALSNKPEMFPDKIHPNAAGARVMSKTILSILKKNH